MVRELDDGPRLQQIASVFFAGSMSRDEARAAVMDVVFERIGCSRVSFWKFERTEGELSLLCFASRTVGGPLETDARRLCESEYRDYFNALIERGTYVSADAMADPALQPMRGSYLLANNVLSMLDAAFLLNGRAYGMVCCEETRSLREWSASDVGALRAIVTRLAILLSGADDPVLWATPSLPLHRLRPDPSAAPRTA